MTTIFYAAEAWFHLSGHINSRNYQIWSSNNPHALEETPLHPIKVGVWCAVSKLRVIGPIFFDRSVDSEVYTKIIQDFIALLELEE